MKKLLYPVMRLSARKKAYHAWPLIFFLIFYLICFHIIEAIPRSYYLAVILPIDREIPFIEAFVIPYLSWFVFVAWGIVTCYLADLDTYDALSNTLMLGMATFLFISAFLPNRQPLRMIEMPRDNVFTRLIAGLWMVDTPTDVWPSIHVFNTVAVMMAMLKSGYPGFRKTLFRVLLIIWSVLIILSTMLIKQHSVFDVLTALVLIAVCYIRIYREKAIFRFRKWDRLALRLEAEAMQAEAERKKRKAEKRA